MRRLQWWVWFRFALALVAVGAPLQRHAGAQALSCAPAAGGAGGLFGGAGASPLLSLGVGGSAAAPGETASTAQCAPGEAASVATDEPPALAGNPVDLLTGIKVDRAIDAYLRSASRDALADAAELVFSRFYASGSAGSQALGPGWRLGLEARVHATGGEGTMPVIVQGDGRWLGFGPARGSGGIERHEALVRDDGVLERVRTPPGAPAAGWTWRWRSGRRLHFDPGGRLARIESPAGASIVLDRDRRGRLVAVRTAAGTGVALRYYHDAGAAGDSAVARVGAHPGRLAELRGSAGLIARYAYDATGRLARVRFAGGATLAYDYADDGRSRLAAVTLPDGRRSEYRYGADGRVVYSRAAGESDEQALRFEHRPPTSAAGQGETRVSVGGRWRATYRWSSSHAAQRPLLVSSVGPGCARCPPTGNRFRYDAAGRVAEVWHRATAHGSSSRLLLAIRRDAAGRPVEIHRAGQGRVRIDWLADPVLDRPARIERPSVVAGRRVVLRPVYDALGRAASVEQSGHAPTVDLDAAGGVVVGAVPIRRELRSVAALAASPGSQRFVVADGMRAQLWRDDFGRVVALRSVDAGLVRREFDDAGRLGIERRADGSIARYRYDDDGRLVEYRELGAGATHSPDPQQRESVTRYAWSAFGLARIEGEQQGESLTFDADGRVVARGVSLRLESGRTVAFDLRFEYGADGRLRAWSLPGGGWVRALGDGSGQTVALEWQPAEGALSLPLVGALARDRHGVRRAVYGNGVELSVRRTDDGRIAAIRHRVTRGRDRNRDLMHHRLAFDAHGRLVGWRRDAQSRVHLFDRDGQLLQAVHREGRERVGWRFAYDGNGNRVLAQQPAGSEPGAPAAATRRFARQGQGDRTRPLDAAAGPGHAVTDAIGPAAARRAWDAAGRLIADGERSYRWDAGGRLTEVREAGRTLARYRYDARGLRIAKLADGIVTHFLHDGQRRLLAELDADGVVRRQYIHLADRPVVVLDRADGGSAHGPARWRVRYLHLNHLGAPEVVTDERARPIWRAGYAPFGRRLGASTPRSRAAHDAQFDLPLRLPGQYEDRETGLHYNDHRYYDPDAGRYLGPDPLGLAAGPNPYAYAANDPLTRIDPSGLLLFAFDGTGNSDPPQRRDDWSNVYKLSRAYADGRVWYMSGVGTDDAASGIGGGVADALAAGSARARVDHLLRELDASAAAATGGGAPLVVDVIGFSRGAAMARDFANRVAERIRTGGFATIGACVRLRFLGLWDTVAQFGVDGVANAAWRLAVPTEVAYAAHAVALNEHRTLFPAESIVGSPLAGVRIERGFVGAHSDVGGSYGEGDLSDVALVWMHAQARDAGVAMFALTSEFARVSAPLLHDSNPGGAGDREFRYRNAWGWTFANPLQRVAPVGGLRWADTGQFVIRHAAPLEDVYGQPTIAGEVDIAGYAAWLDANYAITVGGGP